MLLLPLLTAALALPAPAGVLPILRPGWSVITVLPGENTPTLASRFGVTPEALAGWNPGLPTAPDWGSRVRVLSLRREEERFRTLWRVQARMSVAGVAATAGLTEEQVRVLNRWGPRRRTIAAGEHVVLYLPRSRWPGGSLDGGVRLGDGPGLRIKDPQASWGRPVTVRTLEALGRELAAAFPGSLLVVGDLSRERGGGFAPHAGHRTGLEADLGLFRKGEPWRLHFAEVPPEELDAARTWWLVRRLLETGRVERVLVDWHLQALLLEEARRDGVPEPRLEEWFQVPRRGWEEAGVIRHYRGHRNHLHVRFREVPEEVIL
ncbi:MAG: penicillin-insensitive murein endopeptidase [Deltaproteobacteria bacterium]|nr:penicillin-insensitive murein endopeptidase [Deltaproteobacteria bacterium]